MFSKIKSKDKAAKLREYLNAKDIIVMPGCYDSLSAKLIEKEGLGVVLCQALLFPQLG